MFNNFDWVCCELVGVWLALLCFIRCRWCQSRVWKEGTCSRFKEFFSSSEYKRLLLFIAFISLSELILLLSFFYLLLWVCNLFQRRSSLHFKSDWDETWQQCSSHKYASIARVRFLTYIIISKWCTSSFHTEKCCYVVNVHRVSAMSLLDL